MIYVIPEALEILSTNLDETNLGYLTDEKVYTQAEHSDSIEIELRTNVQEWLWMQNIDAKEIYIIQRDSDGNVIFERTFYLDDGGVDDIWSYFYAQLEYRRSFLVPLFVAPGGTLFLRLSGFESVKVGQLVIGRGVYIGKNEYEASVGIHDYSKIEVDESGEALFVQGKCASIYETKVYVDPKRVASTKRKMEKVRGEPVLWIGSINDEAKVLYGYFKGFEPIYRAGGSAVYNLEIEGVV